MMEALVFLDAVDGLSLKDSKNAQKQTESSNVKLMDDMEKSVPKNGNFFIKIGQKAPDTHPEFDTRVLILKIGIKNNNQEDPDVFDYVAITRDGPKKMSMTQEEFQILFLARTPHSKDTFLKRGKGHPDQISLHISNKTWDLEDLQTNGEEDLLQYVLSESIKAAQKEPEMPTTPSQTLSDLLNHQPPQPSTLFTT